MINKKTLSLKLNKSLQMAPDAPFTPVDQTLQTPVDVPNHNAYYGFSSSGPHHESSFFSQASDVDSDEVMTDVDEPSVTSKMLRTYSVAFTPSFDQMLMDIYSHILSLPTTTPFSGIIPPSGLLSRVANETLHKIIMDSDPSSGHTQTIYDTQGMLGHEQLKNSTTTHIVLQLIRKRLLDLCALPKGSKNKSSSGSNSGYTSVQVAVAAQVNNQNSFGQNNSIYSGSGLRQSSISNLSLNEHNTANYQQNQNQNQNQVHPSVLSSSRSRSSSLKLRKHSLTRNNSHTGSSWLHVGNLSNVRKNGNLGSNPELFASSDSLQSMNDFVPHAFLSKQDSCSSTYGTSNGSTVGFNAMMMDYQTPPSSSKSSIYQGPFTPSGTPRDNACSQPSVSADSISDTETGDLSFSRTRSVNRGVGNCSFPKPLTINNDMNQMNHNSFQSNNPGDPNLGVLNSPFVSGIPAPDDFEYFGQENYTANALENASSNISGLRNGPLISESSLKEGTKPAQFCLSEKKRDSLKLKRGIH